MMNREIYQKQIEKAAEQPTVVTRLEALTMLVGDVDRQIQHNQRVLSTLFAQSHLNPNGAVNVRTFESLMSEMAEGREIKRDIQMVVDQQIDNVREMSPPELAGLENLEKIVRICPSVASIVATAFQQSVTVPKYECPANHCQKKAGISSTPRHP